MTQTMDSLTILAMAAAEVQRSERENRPQFTIRRPRSSDIPLLEQVERSAAEVFRTVGLDALLNGPTVDPYLLVSIANAGHLWIAADWFDQPIAFLAGEYLDGNFHIIEISVSRECQGRGVGKALMSTMIEQVKREGYKSITLTTYKDLPWNAPWYTKMGFTEVKAWDMGKNYEALVEEEARLGLDTKSRCVMRKTF